MIEKFVVGVVVAIFLAGPVVLGQDGLSYSGSSTVGMGVLEEGVVKAFEEETGIEFTSIEFPGSGKGVQALIDGKVNLAGASRPLTIQEKKKRLLGTTIGYDGIAVFVHASNPVESLTKQQLKGIFTGAISNWKEVGGKDAPIAPNTEILGEKRATMLEFQKLAMDGAPYGAGFKEIDLPRDQVEYLSKDDTGICSVSYGLLASVSGSVRQRVKVIAVDGIEPTPKNIRSGAYPISRPLLLATKGLPKGDVKKLIKFVLSEKGQEIVARNFVPVRSVAH